MSLDRKLCRFVVKSLCIATHHPKSKQVEDTNGLDWYLGEEDIDFDKKLLDPDDFDWEKNETMENRKFSSIHFSKKKNKK